MTRTNTFINPFLQPKRLHSFHPKIMQQPQSYHKKRLPIFHKVSNLLRISIIVCKMKKPAITRLIFLHKSRKLKRLMLLIKHYNSYGFLKDRCEFSSSSTPLICRYKKQFKHARDNINSMFFFCNCLDGLNSEGGEGVADYSLPLQSLFVAAAVPGEYCFQPLDLGDEEESVDQRAERFIERFYQEVRMQRRESI